MKTFLAIAGLVAFQVVSAQTVKLQDFNIITVGSEIRLDMVKGTENKLVYNGDETFEINYSNGGVAFDGEGSATLFYKSDIEALTVGSDAEVKADDLKSRALQLTVGSDSKVSINLNVQDLQVTAGSDSHVSLTGKANSMRATIGSDGKFSAEGLKAADVSINLGSDADGTMNATGIVNATVGSDASLKVYGKPKKVNEVKGSDSTIKVM